MRLMLSSVLKCLLLFIYYTPKHIKFCNERDWERCLENVILEKKQKKKQQRRLFYLFQYAIGCFLYKINSIYLNLRNGHFRQICLILCYCINGNHILLFMPSGSWNSSGHIVIKDFMPHTSQQMSVGQFTK